MNLRYTDYGRPFDFLKAKNHAYSTKNTRVDTFNVYVPQFKNEIIEITSSTDEVEPSFEMEAVNAEKAFEFNYSNSVDTSVIFQTDKTDHLSGQKFSDRDDLHFKNNITNNMLKTEIRESSWPPEWWTNMWSNLWKWVLKWLLIAIAFLVVLALVIWGIYALIALVANPTVAGIVVFCIVMLLYMLIEFN